MRTKQIAKYSHLIGVVAVFMGFLAGCQLKRHHKKMMPSEVLSARTLKILHQLSQNKVHIKQIGQAITLTFPANHYYYAGSAHLKPNSQQFIQQIHELLQHYPVENLTISGITKKYENQRVPRSLALERARHLSRALERHADIPIIVAKTREFYEEHHPWVSATQVNTPYMTVAINALPLNQGNHYG